MISNKFLVKSPATHSLPCDAFWRFTATIRLKEI